MLKRTLAAGCVLALVVPGVAQAATPSSAQVHHYLRLYHAVRSKDGPRAAGCNLIRGQRGWCHVRVTPQALAESEGVLERILAPPAPVQTVSRTYTAAPRTYAPTSTYSSSYATTRSYTPSTTSSYSGGGGAGGVPACASESGTNYSTGAANTNPSSGATGRYQITPGTAANYGCNLGTPGGQDACAQVIYAHQGASAWVGCGG